MSRKFKTPDRLPYSLALLALVTGASHGRAQYVDWAGVQEVSPWTAVAPRLRYIRTDVEAEQDTYRSPGIAQQQVERLYLTTGFGVAWNNYIYHPYLLTYSLMFEPGYVWQEDGPAGQLRQSNLWLLDGTGTVNLLEVKPYATSFSYNRTHQETKYDFFSPATVDTDGWNANTGYNQGPVPVMLSFSQSHEDSSGLNQSSITDQTLLNLHASNERQKNDATDLTYQYGIFDRETDVLNSSYRSEDSYHHVSLTDVEHFQKSTLRSSILFNDIQAQNSSSSQLNGMLNWNVQHTPHLLGFYDYSFSRDTGNQSESIQNAGSAGLTHQLYESLTSSFQINGSTLSSSSAGSTLDAYQAGASLSENYTKRLGNWGGLSLSDNASYSYNEQQTSGSQLVISAESYKVPNTRVVLLTQPREISIQTVTDATGTRLLVLGADYTVNQTTDPWQVQINPINSANIQPGDSILVSYTVLSNPSGSYGVIANQSQITFSFWNDHADVFARYSFTDNQASSPGFVFENDEEFAVGGDFNWRNFSVHGDYTDHRSSLYNSKTYDLSENYAVTSFANSTLGLSMNQQWSTYTFNSATTNLTQNVTFYDFMLHYDVRPRPSLSWNTEVGYRRQRGLGADQDLFAARTYLNWVRGKLEVHLGYEHESQSFNSHFLGREYVFARVRRNF